jgi:hypothetical protein
MKMSGALKELAGFNGDGDPWEGYDFSKPSRAVVAENNGGEGAVLWYAGGNLGMEIREGGMGSHTDDLGLHPPKPGIWIWEGKSIWIPGPWECPQDGSTELHGDWREPTEEEWQSIRGGVCPWNDEDWLLPTCQREDNGTRCDRPDGHKGGCDFRHHE